MFIFHNTQVSIMGYTQNDKKYTLFTKKYIIRVILETKIVLPFYWNHTISVQNVKHLRKTNIFYYHFIKLETFWTLSTRAQLLPLVHECNIQIFLICYCVKNKSIFITDQCMHDNLICIYVLRSKHARIICSVSML